MGEFNFYVNIDDCLNMSIFDIFFYKLQSERKFYVVDATFQDDLEEHSVENALKGVGNYIGQSFFPIRDYRLIFGMRQRSSEMSEWKGTVLYRLLKIYYGLKDAHIYIKTRDQNDKNVTVILLYDVEDTYEEREIPEEIVDHTKDIPLLMKYLGVKWDDDRILNEKSIAEEMLNTCKRQDIDQTTKRFVKDYYERLNHSFLEEMDSQENSGDASEESEAPRNEHEKDACIYNRVNGLITFIERCVGQYCVFTKMVPSTPWDHRLALLSIVDYITTGLMTDNNENLKQKALTTWKAARDDDEIIKKYGKLMKNYEKRLSDRLHQMEKSVLSSTEEPPVQIKDPDQIKGDFTGTSFSKDVKECLDNYRENGVSAFRRKGITWEKVEQELKELIGSVGQSMEEYSEQLSISYKRELSKRKLEKKQKSENNEIYSIELIDDKLRDVQRKKKVLLETLEKQRMNSVIQYQDQLNADAAIRECGQKIRFCEKRCRSVTLGNFIQLVFSAGCMVLLHHILLQESLMDNMWNVFAFALCEGIIFVLSVTTFSLPGMYYRRRVKKELSTLESRLVSYMHGYKKRADDFAEYIDIINKIDVMNVYAEELEEMKNRSQKENRSKLWHKARIEEHLRKCTFFRLINTPTPEEDKNELQPIGLDFKKGVIHNPFYWPQRA